MIKTFSDKAMLTKARAMFGNRLIRKDYDELLRKESVPEVAAYLKNETHYRDILAGTDADSIHRGQLENLLRRNRFTRYMRLIHYDFAGGRDFYRYLLVGAEIAEILHMIRLLDAGKPEEYAFMLPTHLEAHTSFSLKAMASVKRFDELLVALERTDYRDILARFAPPDGKTMVDLTACETALMTYYYRFLFDRIQKEYHGATRARLREMVEYQVDADNLVHVYRLKLFFHADEAYIRSCLLPFDTPGKNLIEKMIGAASAGELRSIVEKSRLGRFAQAQSTEFDSEYIEDLTKRGRSHSSYKNMRFSVETPVVIVSFMTQQDIEVENLINIIEGIRYSLDSGDIARMLIIN